MKYVLYLFSDSRLTAQSVSLSTVRGKFVLKCAEAEDMEALVVKYLDGLRERSVYALTQEDASKPGRDQQHFRLRHTHLKNVNTKNNTYACATSSGDLAFLVCKQGDLLLVEKDRSLSAANRTFRATNQRTRSSGLVLKDVLQFLPTLSRPSDETLVKLGQKQIQKCSCK